MKSESDIRERLETLKEEVDIAKVVSYKHPHVEKNAKINALEWVLSDDE